MKTICIKNYGFLSFTYIKGRVYRSHRHRGTYIITVHAPGTNTGVVLDPIEFDEHFVYLFKYGK